jgi:hypothetical protein
MQFINYYKKLESFLNEEINRSLRKFLILFLFLGLFVLLIVSFDKSTIPKCYQLYTSDWLINYSGGFVRRGLLGSFILKIAQLTSLKPALVVAIFKILSYSAIYLSAIYLIIKAKYFKNVHIFLFLYQTTYIFPLLDFRGGGRKEILLLALFSLFSLLNKENLSRTLMCLLSALLLALSFAHDALFWFYPLVLLCLQTILPNGNLSIKTCFFILLPSILSTALILNFGTKMSPESLDLMTKAIDPENYKLWAWPISYVTWDFNTQATNFLKNFDNYSVINLLFTLFLAFIPFGIAAKIDNHSIYKNDKFLYTLCACLLFQAPLILAKDWGRWIYVDATILSLTYLITLNKVKKFHFKYSAKQVVESYKKTGAVILVLLVFLFSWRMKHCCASTFELTLQNHFNWISRL